MATAQQKLRICNFDVFFLNADRGNGGDFRENEVRIRGGILVYNGHVLVFFPEKNWFLWRLKFVAKLFFCVHFVNRNGPKLEGQLRMTKGYPGRFLVKKNPWKYSAHVRVYYQIFCRTVANQIRNNISFCQENSNWYRPVYKACERNLAWILVAPTISWLTAFVFNRTM